MKRWFVDRMIYALWVLFPDEVVSIIQEAARDAMADHKANPAPLVQDIRQGAPWSKKVVN